ncbi:MAG TPA: DUF1707 domain-containing protein [Streptosporangiaceae bacterium]|nr:DUF1707 domain-containing protein [Streptosporangiaceae bacterium]
MSASSSPHVRRGNPYRRGTSYGDPDLRVSDAERAEVADRLAKHYGDGRLDQAEFDHRLDQAMGAKTQSDLAGLFADLPGTDTPADLPGAGKRTDPPGADAAKGAARQRNQRPHRHHRILVLVVAIVVAAAVGHALMHSFVPWLLIGLLAFFWLRYET